MTVEQPVYLVPRVALHGSPYEIGLQHGMQLQSQIFRQLAFYRILFQKLCKLEWGQVLEIAKEFQVTIQQLTPDLYEEIRGIADGVGGEVGVLDIVALNARSEIALGKFDDGCTSLAWTIHPASGGQSQAQRQILAQNWDWNLAVGKNLAMVSITKVGKPKIWMVIEPGIIGKIGFNSASVGVCLNAIRARPMLTTLLPIHLFLRIALECTSVNEAIATFEKLGGPASSQHILIADSTSGSRGLEVSPLGSVYLKPNEQGFLSHSNHFLENKFVEEPPWLTGSPGRLSRITELCRQIKPEELVGDDDKDTAATILRTSVFSDTKGAPQGICGEGEQISTLFNIVMQFESGKKPYAHVFFGKPNPADVGQKAYMPW